MRKSEFSEKGLTDNDAPGTPTLCNKETTFWIPTVEENDTQTRLGKGSMAHKWDSLVTW
jgi:hypothetical protein